PPTHVLVSLLVLLITGADQPRDGLSTVAVGENQMALGRFPFCQGFPSLFKTNLRDHVFRTGQRIAPGRVLNDVPVAFLRDLRSLGHKKRSLIPVADDENRGHAGSVLRMEVVVNQHLMVVLIDAAKAAPLSGEGESSEKDRQDQR